MDLMFRKVLPQNTFTNMTDQCAQSKRDGKNLIRSKKDPAPMFKDIFCGFFFSEIVK